MTLHIVNRSPYSANALIDCLASFAEGDALLLIEDGVYALGTEIAAKTIYCLEVDAQARGLQIPENVEAIDDARWVELCTQHKPIVSWFK